MSTDDLTPPGSATYSSGTMYVGDGTWDSSSNTFLLPNLQGLNYATTRYNGMGARFADLPGYYNLVIAHGVLAAITFIFIVPFAIMINRFYGRSAYWKLRMHIWAQVMTVLLTTAIFILGWFAVGPERSLTNPHHVIGLALYVMILLQFIFGYLNYKRSNKKRHIYKPLRIMLHQWLGRTIGLLGIIQVALGLTLYGSPVSLFVLYSIAVFILLLAYFVLEYLRSRDGDYYAPDGASNFTGSARPPREKPGLRFGLGEGALLGGALGALGSRLRGRRQTSGRYEGTEYSESQAPSGLHSHHQSHAGASYVSEEKFSEHGAAQERHTWRNRLLELGALGAVGLWFSRRFGRKHAEEDVGSSYYGTYSDISGSSLSRVQAAEEGRPQTPAAPQTPTRLNQSAQQTPNSQERLTRPARTRSQSSVSYDSYMSSSPSKSKPRKGIRDAILGFGAIGAAKGLFDFKKRRERKEQRRIDELRRQDALDQTIQRRKSRRNATGEGSQLPDRRPSMSTVQTSHHPLSGVASAAEASAVPLSAASPAPVAVPPPLGGGSQPLMTGAIPSGSGPLAPPPPIHDPASGTFSSPSASRPSIASGLGQSGRTAAEAAAAGLAGGAAGAALGETHRRSRDNSRARRSEQSPATPVSVKLNMHPDGRHVTLRRLTEEEAAKERESKRTRNRNRRQRQESGDQSLLSDVSPDPTWRRPSRNQYAASSAAGSIAGVSAAAGSPAPVPQGPPVAGPSSSPAGMAPVRQQTAPGPSMSAQSLQPPPSISTLQGQASRRPSGGIPGSVGSPGPYDTGTGTEASQISQTNYAETNYADRARRRRAQRAQAAAGAQQRGPGKKVEFD